MPRSRRCLIAPRAGSRLAAGRLPSWICWAPPRPGTPPAGERGKEPRGFNLVPGGNLAKISKQFLKRGQQFYGEGRFQPRRWEDQEGKKHFTTEVVANEMIMLGERPARYSG